MVVAEQHVSVLASPRGTCCSVLFESYGFSMQCGARPDCYLLKLLSSSSEFHEVRTATKKQKHQLRIKRRGTVNRNWYVDETFIKVRGKNCYLYRAIDSNGNLVDSMPSQKRDMKAAKAFLRQALELAEEPSELVVTDGLTSYPRAISEELGAEVKHERRGCQCKPVESSHRSVKARYFPTLGFEQFNSGKRFYEAFD